MRFVLVVLLLAVGCGGESGGQAPPVNPDKPRVILMHGLHSDIDQFAEPPFVALVDGLEAQGWQVVYVEYPTPATDPEGALAERLRDDPDGYLAAWMVSMRELIGTGTGPVLLGGISWGGWHALHAASLPGVTGWFAQVPVTRVSVLTEFADIDTSSIDVTDLSDVTAPGLVRWATGDDRVNGALAQPVAESSGGPVEVQAVDHDHATTDADVAAILEWTAELREPA